MALIPPILAGGIKGSRYTAAPDICGYETGNSGGVGGPTTYF